MKAHCFLALLWGLILLPAAAPVARAQVEIPQTIAYQGYLTNTDGDPANGATSVIFSLYDDDTGGAQLWQETQQGVVFTDGIFSVQLGSVESLDAVPFGQPLWLNVEVVVSGGGRVGLRPRVPFSAVPYAMSVRGLRTLPGEDPQLDAAPNVILGFEENGVDEGVSGAVIGGGGGTDSAANEVNVSYGTIAGGHTNTIEGFGGTVSGGLGNQAQGEFSNVGGGSNNTTQSEFSTIGGGTSNRTGGSASTVGGGGGNQAEGVAATISGGAGNQATGDEATISGGENNIASNNGATVGGGRENEALGCYDTVAGGDGNRAQADDFGAAFKGAGRSCSATVGGGRKNVAADDGATVAGGVDNTANGSSAVVGGGFNNTASGDGATVPGGERNQARGENSLAAGTEARAAHEGTFVWSDNASADSLVSTADHQFLIRARGGVGIGTNAPEGALHIADATLDIDTNGFSEEALVVEGLQPVIGVYAAFQSNTRPGLVLAGVDGGNVVDKWAIVREFFSGNALHFTYGLNEDHTQNQTVMTLSDANGNFLSVPDGVISTGRLQATNTLGPTPTPSTGSVYRDNVVYAWAHVQSDGTVTASYGCTVSKITGFGSYRISFKRQLPNGASAVVTVQTLNDPVIATAVTSAAEAQVSTKVFNGAAFVAADYGFYIQVVGRP